MAGKAKANLSDLDKLHLKDLKEYGLKLEKNCFYTMQRMDILIILLSTSGILILINLTETFYKYQIYNVAILKLCVSLFSASIVLNLLSQSYAYVANENARLINVSKIYDLRFNGIIKEDTYKKKKEIAEKQGQRVTQLNYASLACLLFGMIVSTISFWIIA